MHKITMPAEAYDTFANLMARLARHRYAVEIDGGTKVTLTRIDWRSTKSADYDLLVFTDEHGNEDCTPLHYIEEVHIP